MISSSLNIETYDIDSFKSVIETDIIELKKYPGVYIYDKEDWFRYYGKYNVNLDQNQYQTFIEDGFDKFGYNLYFPRNIIVCSVVNNLGHPEIGIEIYIDELDETLYTNDQGIVQFVNIPYGEYHIHIKYDDIIYDYVIELTENNNIKYIYFRYLTVGDFPNNSIICSVVDNLGHPKIDITIYIDELNETFHTNNKGILYINNIPYGEYHIHITYPNTEIVTHVRTIDEDNNSLYIYERLNIIDETILYDVTPNYIDFGGVSIIESTLIATIPESVDFGYILIN